MTLCQISRWSSLVVLCALAACGASDSAGPKLGPPARLEATAALSQTAEVGSILTNAVAVKVTDASGHALAGVSVGFSVTLGSGSVNPRVNVTDANGQAWSTWTLGTVTGNNQVVAGVNGLPSVTFSAVGAAGAAKTITVVQRSLQLLPSVDTARISAQTLDSFGNVASPGPTFVSRDPTLLTVDANGFMRALRRGASTWVVITAGSVADSVQVTVLAVGQSACTGVATPLDLAVGQVVTGFVAGSACIHGSVAGAEYALIPYYDAVVAGTVLPLEVRPLGITALSLPSASIARSSPGLPASLTVPAIVPDYTFESALRDRERREVPSRITDARAWYNGRRAGRSSGVTAALAAAVPAVGDLMPLNANTDAFCSNPINRTGRVAAVTEKAIIVADTANPAGGFTDEEYRSIAVTFDTLVDPTNRAAFGTPTDIDNNGHVILFFTRAVNELTSAGSSSTVLGLFYQRDLFPKVATPPVTQISCPASNVAEMFYLLVPDPDGAVNGNKRSKATVLTITNGTVAHEYQHLINASRRMYVNNAGTGTEEKWLDEGLAHIAEELNFFKAGKRQTKTNIDAGAYTDQLFLSSYSTFELNNFNRYKTYLTSTESQAPIGSDPSDADLQTRGAGWNFLRFVADHLTTISEQQFWFNLVNSTTTGVANFTQVLGTPPNLMMRDWAISVFLDDNAANVDPRFQEPSWNLRSLFTNGGASQAFPLTTRTLADNVTTSLTLYAYGTSFLRFAVPVSGDALIRLTSNNQTLPASVQVAVVRVK